MNPMGWNSFLSNPVWCIDKWRGVWIVYLGIIGTIYCQILLSAKFQIYPFENIQPLFPSSAAIFAMPIAEIQNCNNVRIFREVDDDGTLRYGEVELNFNSFTAIEETFVEHSILLLISLILYSTNLLPF